MVLNQVNVEPVQLHYDDQSTDPAAAHAGTYNPHANNALGHHLAGNDLLHVSWRWQFGNTEFLKYTVVIVIFDIHRVSFSITEEEEAN